MLCSPLSCSISSGKCFFFLLKVRAVKATLKQNTFPPIFSLLCAAGRQKVNTQQNLRFAFNQVNVEEK